MNTIIHIESYSKDVDFSCIGVCFPAGGREEPLQEAPTAGKWSEVSAVRCRLDYRKPGRCRVETLTLHNLTVYLGQLQELLIFYNSSVLHCVEIGQPVHSDVPTLVKVQSNEPECHACIFSECM